MVLKTFDFNHNINIMYKHSPEMYKQSDENEFVAEYPDFWVQINCIMTRIIIYI